MTPNLVVLRDDGQKLLMEGARISLFLVVLGVSLISYLLQPAFINWPVLGPFYALVSGAFCLHLFILGGIEAVFRRPWILFATFVIDSALISALISFSGLGQSLFLFLHLLNILLAGLVFQTQGALLIALLTSLFFTTAATLGPDMKALQFVLLLALNNIAFFLVAGLSGYLSEQLEMTGQALAKTGLNLKAARELNRLVVENIPSGLVTFSPDGQILQANKSASEILEVSGITERNLFDLIGGLRGPSEVGELEKRDVKYQAPGSDSKVLGVLFSSFESPDLGGSVRIALMEDLTKIRRLENRVRQSEKLAAVGQLAAGIAHEIRNPLAGISGSVELLSQTTQNEDDRKLMKIILREIERLNHLITEFLDYSRPEAPPTDPVDLVPLLEETLQGIVLNKGLREDVQLVKELPVRATILGRREKLKQVFLNLVINAYQATQDTLRPLVEVRVTQTGNQIVVIVKDNGGGMTEATRKRLFEPFHTTKPKGTGLGLAIAHKILEGHSASVEVDSEQGQGTEFRVSFPAVLS